MTLPILPISPASLPEAIRSVAQPKSGGGFQDVFASAVQTVETQGQKAAASMDSFLSGEGGELHTTILATQKAELSFELFMQTRNKVVSAYQEVMRMQM
jgi:flagellar hook-basal body complex protein FliE